MEIVLIFREIDADDSGEIDASELRTALCNTAGMSSQNELTNVIIITTIMITSIIMLL